MTHILQIGLVGLICKGCGNELGLPIYVCVSACIDKTGGMCFGKTARRLITRSHSDDIIYRENNNRKEDSMRNS